MGELGFDGRTSVHIRATSAQRAHDDAAAANGRSCVNDVELAWLRRLQLEDRERAFVGIEEDDRERASWGASPFRPRGGELALEQEGWIPRRASAGVAPWSP
jgi:hypothetical protein